MALALIKRYSHIDCRSDTQFIKQIVQDYMEYRELIEKIIGAEKDNMHFPFDEDHYVENYSDHYWEAGSCKTYENWYIRYEFEYAESGMIPEESMSDMFIKLTDWAEEDLSCLSGSN